MKTSNRYIPILITVALLALIGLQINWLFLVFKQKEQELRDKTREAVIETSRHLKEKEDEELIIENMDSLLLTDNIIGSNSKEDVRVIVSSIKNKFKIDTIKERVHINHELNIINDSSESTTIVNLSNGKMKKIVISSQSSSGSNQNKHIETASLQLEHEVLEKQKIRKKVKELQTVFFKMALSSGTADKDIDSMYKFSKVEPILKEKLLKQGINMEPAFALYFFPHRHPAKIKYHVICGTPGFGKLPGAFLNMPFYSYSENFYDGDISIKLDYVSTTNFVLRQMAGLLGLSLFITLLIGFVMIYIFRRMLSQEKLHRLKNDFINNMTHELKTPIATISLAIDGINNPAIKNDEAKFNNYTSILKEENKKLNNHVERVLQMALLEKGELMLDKKTVDLKSLLENCINTQQLQIQNKKAKVVLNAADEVTFTGDEFHLINAFTNLLDNALKYSGENCEITISLNKQGEISFKDNGIGIDKSIQEKIFEKFYRAQGGNLHDVKGFGLGLSYVKSIIEAHGGTIGLKSEKNKGSEFIIKLKNHVN
ncbi:MAG: HAMP domain-containing histidine kinase [Sphingobacteriaceae bacterium]|nr:HAMP domain-containing histidine kinase [Sphingobacteriaceae bacterium]